MQLQTLFNSEQFVLLQSQRYLVQGSAANNWFIMNLGIFLFLVASVRIIMGARILAVFPVPAKSHHIQIHSIVSTIAQAGHEVVCYTAVPSAKKVANLTEVYLTSTVAIEETMTKEMFESILNMNTVGAATALWPMLSAFLGNLNEDKHFMQLVNSNERFDLVILQAFFSQEALFALGHKFEAPVINLQPFGSYSIVSRAHGNPLSLAFIPDYALAFSDHMSFYQRAVNAYSILSTLYKYYTYHIPEQDRYMRTLFNDPSLPPLTDMMQNNLALTFSNAHPYVHYAQPYTSNIIPVGGIHLETEKKPLPADMQKFLDEALEGVVYLSVGSILPDHLLDDEYFNNYLAVFRRLPQRVLWKTKRDLKDLPKNVMTSKWVPQQDVLAHTNVKVFITHGGLFSQHEAIHAGVPVICTPYFGDQPMNAKFYEEKGIGVILPFKTISEETIHSALTRVLNDTQYKDNMARMSQIYRDRPVSPADSVTFWVEYTLRHGDSPNLRPASATMPLYQLYLFDVIALILATPFLILLVLFIIIRRTLNFFSINAQHVNVRGKKVN